MIWLIQLCKKHVEKYVMLPDMTTIVNQTDELSQRTNQRHPCRMEGCQKSYVCHGRRVRHEVADHNLKLQIFMEDERDEYGHYYCRFNCGMVYSTKTIRNRHERMEHDQIVDHQEQDKPLDYQKESPNDDINTGEEGKDPNDYLYNYHQKKLAFGLLLMSFDDAVREGDGQRLFDIYKVTLLLFKANNHPKYAYINLLYLVKICAILPQFEAERLKWNRFINTRGGKGLNISLDLHKEHQNRLLKTMWRALGPNLDEKNAARIAGTLESMENILTGIDKDCKLSNRSSFRSVKKKEEAVNQITTDLVSIDAFQYTRYRKGHPSFPYIESNMFSGLDYRDLHHWMTDKVKYWGSIYE